MIISSAIVPPDGRRRPFSSSFDVFWSFRGLVGRRSSILILRPSTEWVASCGGPPVRDVKANASPEYGHANFHLSTAVGCEISWCRSPPWKESLHFLDRARSQVADDQCISDGKLETGDDHSLTEYITGRMTEKTKKRRRMLAAANLQCHDMLHPHALCIFIAK